MLTKKQQIFFNFIIKCYQKDRDFPTIGTLKKQSKYKSYNSIHKYLNVLEEKGYIKLNYEKKKIIYIKKYLENSTQLTIPIINTNNSFTVTSDLLNIKKEYIAFRLSNNKLNSYLLKNGDILIIEKNKTKLNGKFVLVSINNKYHIFKYQKKDGFIHLVNDKEFYVLESLENIIGKVVSMYRSPMD